MSTDQPLVAVAGAAGHLGSLIALNLRKRNVAVAGLVRPGTAASRTEELRQAGVAIAEVDLADIPSLTKILQGATTLVSALQGLREVIVNVQGNLLHAAVAANVGRFIPSDFSLDFTKTEPGTNRNLDLRREFHDKLDASGIQWTSVLNGAFTELLTSGKLPMINDNWHKIMHFGSATQKLDFTTVPDIAAYTAAVAADASTTPRFLRIAGQSVSATDLAEIVSRVKGREYTTFWTGSVGFLRTIIAILKVVIGGVEDKPMTAWQGMQYLENMISGKGKLDPIDNGRYPELVWTTVEQALKEADEVKVGKKAT